MSAKIARGGSSRGKSRPKSVSRGSTRKPPPPGMLESLSLPADTVRRVGLWLFCAVLLAVAFAVAVAMRVPQRAGVAIGEVVGGAGFTVQRIESKGLNHLNPMQVYRVAEDQLEQPMPLVDLDGTRARLLQFGWVQDARVSRRLPDTLVVDIVERSPAAIWQYNQRLMLVDGDGVVLEPVRIDTMPDLPLVIGLAANRHLHDLNALLTLAPELKPLIAGATWVGDRRWDIRFQTGEVLALPEGDQAARAAFTDFARREHSQRLLGEHFTRFDMRIPGKFVVRVPTGPGGSIGAPTDAAPPAPAAAPPQQPAGTTPASPDTI